MAKEEPWGTHREVCEGGRCLIFSLKQLKQVPPRFSVIGGEVVHDMRSALDHLACYLVEANGGTPTSSTAWPIEQSKWAWRQKVERRAIPFQFWGKKRGDPLKGIPRGSDAWVLIEASQPYNRSDKARNDPLRDLHRLWNTDKHRIINALPTYVDTNVLLDNFTFPVMDPTERKSLITADRPLRDGTKLALFRFDRPYAPVPVDIKLRFQIALGDEKRDDMHLRKTLSIIRTLVEEATVAYPPPA